MAQENCFRSSLRRHGSRTDIVGCQVCRLWRSGTDTRRALLDACPFINPRSRGKPSSLAALAGPASAASPSSRRRNSRQPDTPALRELGQDRHQGGPNSSSGTSTSSSNPTPAAVGPLSPLSQPRPRPAPSASQQSAAAGQAPVPAAQLPYTATAAVPDLDKLSALIPAFSLDDILAGKPVPLDALSAGGSEAAVDASGAAGPSGAAAAGGDAARQGQSSERQQNLSGLKRRALRPWERAAAAAAAAAPAAPAAPVAPAAPPPPHLREARAWVADQGPGSSGALRRAAQFLEGAPAGPDPRDTPVAARAPTGPSTFTSSSTSSSNSRPSAAAATASPASTPLSSSAAGTPADAAVAASTGAAATAAAAAGGGGGGTAAEEAEGAVRAAEAAAAAGASDAAAAVAAVGASAGGPPSLLPRPHTGQQQQQQQRGQPASRTVSASAGAASASRPSSLGSPGTAAVLDALILRPAQPKTAKSGFGATTKGFSGPMTTAPAGAASDVVEPAAAAAAASASATATAAVATAGDGAAAGTRDVDAGTGGAAPQSELGLDVLRFAGPAPLLAAAEAAAACTAAAAAGTEVVRSTRAPRAARVRSKEWVAAAQAVEAAAAARPAGSGVATAAGGSPAWGQQWPPAAVDAVARGYGYSPQPGGGGGWTGSGTAMVPEAVSEPRGILVLHEAPLRGALEAAEAPSAGPLPSRDELPAAVDRRTWRLHAAVLFPDLYDPDWHGCLFDFLFELWPEVGRAHVTAAAANGSGGASRRLLLTSDAELTAALAADAAAAGGGGVTAPPPPPPARVARAAALLDDAYAFAARCFVSADFAVRSALVVSALDCMDDHDALMEHMAARLPPPLVQRLMVPLAASFQPPWVVEEWRGAVADAYPGYAPGDTVPRRWRELVQRLEEAQVVHPGGGLGVVHAVLEFEEEEQDRRQPPPPPQELQYPMQTAQAEAEVRGAITPEPTQQRKQRTRANKAVVPGRGLGEATVSKESSGGGGNGGGGISSKAVVEGAGAARASGSAEEEEEELGADGGVRRRRRSTRSDGKAQGGAVAATAAAGAVPEAEAADRPEGEGRVPARRRGRRAAAAAAAADPGGGGGGGAAPV